jgi:hypothetical protein
VTVWPSPGKNPSTQQRESSAAWCEIRRIGAIKNGEEVTGNEQGVAHEIEEPVRRGCYRSGSHTMEMGPRLKRTPLEPGRSGVIGLRSSIPP